MKKTIAQMADEYAKKVYTNNEVGQIIRSTAYQLGARDAIINILEWNCALKVQPPTLTHVLCKTINGVHVGMRRSDNYWVVEDNSALYTDETIIGWRFIYEPTDAFEL